MTTVSRPYPTRAAVRFQGKRSQVALDQFPAVDPRRLVKKLETIPAHAAEAVSVMLVEMFTR